MTYKSLKLALENTIEKLEQTATSDKLSYPISFHERIFKINQKVYSCSDSIDTFETNISHYFSPYQTYGKDKVGEILLTSYYEPHRWLMKRTSKLNIAIQSTKEPFEVKLNNFKKSFMGD